MVRQERHKAMEEIAKGGADEDTQKRREKEVQKLVDETGEKLDELLAEKEKEILTL